jgi:nucleoside-diphosphate-sugar epimerase
MQTILGSGGAIGKDLAKDLLRYTPQVRLVSRTPQKVNETDELIAADLTKKEDADRAVAGSDIAYLTVGLPYRIAVWQRNWVPLMRNVIEACRRHDTKLVFFDNVYMYAPSAIPHMTEEAPAGPASKKGQVRKEVAELLLEAVDKGEVQGLIARSADFYGPGVEDSVIVETVFKPFAKGQKANWMGKADKVHSFTFTPDAAKATAMLGNTENAYGQVWHLPTRPDPPTGREWIEAIAREMGVEPRYREVGSFMLKLMGLFVPEMREMPEMLYQNTQDYVFDSSKFDKHFGFTPTAYEQGIKEVVAALEKS